MSANLAISLEQKCTGICGTMRKDRREVPKKLKEHKFLKNNTDTLKVLRHKNLLLMKMKITDKKELYMMSNANNTQPSDLEKVNYNKEKYKSTKPLMSEFYNLFARGVDRAYQLNS